MGFSGVFGWGENVWFVAILSIPGDLILCPDAPASLIVVLN
jgi:hypothetical protein